MNPQDAVESDGRLSYYAARECVIVLITPLAKFKVCRINFGKDGSIYVSFPYCKEKSGILSELQPPDGATGPITYNLDCGGMRVSTDTKFSHHRSGAVQFSKTGFFRKAPRRQSFPLDGPIGHVFDLNVYWPAGFDLLEKPKKKDLHLAFGFRDRHPVAVLINAQWRRKADILANTDPPHGKVSPSTEVTHRESGLVRRVHFLGQPQGYPLRDHLLMITGGEVQLPTGADRTGMVFVGGWNTHEDVGDSSTPRKDALVFMYPAGGRPVP